MDNLNSIAESVRLRFEAVDAVREKAYRQSREIIRVCATTIRAIHRSEWEEVHKLMAEAKQYVAEITADTQTQPSIYYAGYTQDSLKEYVEAELTYALVRDLPLKTPDELGVDEAVWMNGLAEAATELRRRILDIIRHNHSEESERLLDNMDAIYSLLVTLDFHDAVTGGLRRRTDTVRAVLERTRGDVTTSLRQAQLEQALAQLDAKLK